MGYESNFTLELNEPIEGLTKKLNELTGYYFYGGDSDADLDDAKWYDWQVDIEEMSSKYPTNVFDIQQVGEDGEGKRLIIKDGVVESLYVRGWEQRY